MENKIIDLLNFSKILNVETKISVRSAKELFFYISSFDKNTLIDKESDLKLIKKNLSDVFILQPFLDSNNTGIPSMITEENLIYNDIFFIFLKFKSKNLNKEIFDLINSKIQKLQVLIFGYNNQDDYFKVFFSKKRISKNTTSKLVVVNSYLSNSVNINSTDNNFLKFDDNLSYVDFYSFYTSYVNRIINHDAKNYKDFRLNNINFDSIELFNEFKSLYYEREKLIKTKARNVSDREMIFNRINEISIQIDNLKNKLN